ncbi:UDP-glucosyltransferase 45 [Psilocybe cubensis]|uniref:UDP-glucosyltransferase 45 n=2 Tax=Psilocybe cubensis TaxID=181762 RepID=A0ACB8GRK8_PSICU|nr:UDP-glucosyltransferase 45 [Psilocybe cubensis]KAH9478360.1 UDP-glucosyltransferase 45 [Psilocybe cubensis]
MPITTPVPQDSLQQCAESIGTRYGAGREKDTPFSLYFVAVLGYVLRCKYGISRLINPILGVRTHQSLSPAYLKNAEAEIAAELDSGEASPETRQRVRFLSSFRTEATADFFNNITLMFQSFPTIYRDLWNGKSVTCATTGKSLDAVDAISAYFVDAYASPLIPMARAITGESVPIISFLPVHASYILHLHGPEEMGGHGDLGAKIDAEAVRSGVTTKEIGDKLFYHTEGKVNRVPGLPPMYDWEHFPQKIENDMPVSDFLRLAYSGFEACDALLSLSAYDFEPESMEALKMWYAKQWGKELYAVGPLVASRPTKYGISSNNDSISSDIEHFLDEALHQYGEKSLVLLSFGSIFWPSKSEYVEEVVEALIEKKFPFIVSYASPYAKLSDALINKVNASGIGIISKWIPQKFILDHQATGWFITHAGQSGVLESLDSGVPMICWPFKFDQSPASAYLSECLQAAFELVEVRTGESGMKPMFRHGRKPQGTLEAVGAEIREVLDACRGEKGSVLRRNAEDMKLKFSKSWGPDGHSRRNFDDFLRKFELNLHESTLAL